uniref:Uncharacterized protein n=1 Tax=viral metagenome TaxID=1070528 RepID=A0A6C0I8A5_9ZZZZ
MKFYKNICQHFYSITELFAKFWLHLYNEVMKGEFS